MTIEEQRKTFTALQLRFADEYLKDPSDGGEAYLRANPKLTNKKSASVQASKLLKMEKFQKLLEEKAKDMLGPVQARILKNVEFWLEIRDCTTPGTNKGPLVSRDEVMGILKKYEKLQEQVSELQSYVVPTTRVADRMKASESLAKWMQMFVEKKEITMEAAVKIVDDIK